MKKYLEYIETAKGIIEKISTEGAPSIEKAAEVFADTLINGKKVFLFGTGHSHMLSEELFYRAGGLVNIQPILVEPLMLHISASESTNAERVEGYAEKIFADYGMAEGDTVVIISNSGRNGVAIDLALIAKERGITTVVITNMEHTMQGKSRHSSGKKLYELGTIVIDNCGCIGDASMHIPEIGRNVAPTSTSAGAAILNAIEARAVEIMVENGYTPDVFSSSNVDGGDEINNAYIEKYKKEIKSL